MIDRPGPRASCVVLLATLLLAIAAYAGIASAARIAVPQPQGYVSDYAGILPD